MTAEIPDAMASRIDAGMSEIAASGVACGLAVGDQAPEFTLPGALGPPVSLSELLALGPVVLTFYRGEWCPYCNIQLRAVQAALPSLLALGASLEAISPQSVAHSLSPTEKHELAFPVLSDLDEEVVRAHRVHLNVAGDLEDLQVNVWQNDQAPTTAPITVVRSPCPTLSSSTATASSGTRSSLLIGARVPYQPTSWLLSGNCQRAAEPTVDLASGTGRRAYVVILAKSRGGRR
jgi:peroxiredoxin